MGTGWYDVRESFEVGELELLVEKIGRIGQVYRHIYHRMPTIYASVAFALCNSHDCLAFTNCGY